MRTKKNVAAKQKSRRRPTVSRIRREAAVLIDAVTKLSGEAAAAEVALRFYARYPSIFFPDFMPPEEERTLGFQIGRAIGTLFCDLRMPGIEHWLDVQYAWPVYRVMHAELSKLSPDDFARKWPGYGKRLTRDAIVQKAHELNMRPFDVALAAIKQGYTITL